MPQIDLFLTDDDTTKLVEDLLVHSCRLVPNLFYPTPSFKEWEIKSVDEYVRFRARGNANLYFAVSPEFSSSPLEFDRVERDGKTGFFVAQKTGGPTLDLFLPRSFEKGGKECLPSGFIGYHPKYLDTNAREMKSVPDSLKALFAEIRRKLKKSCLRESSGKRTFLVGPATQVALTRGLTLINPCVR